MAKADKNKQFINTITEGYEFPEGSILLGAAIYNDKVLAEAPVNACLSTLNRHGLIAGATGTGKTRTLQKLAESLSAQGCSVLVMDIKGDLSGLSQPGVSNVKITARNKEIGATWKPQQFPVEFLSISHEKGVNLRATVSEFGPVLFSRILDVNDTQAGAVSLIFKYCDDHNLPLLDLKDFKKALQFLTTEGKNEIKDEYGGISSTSTNAIMRKMIELEEQGADQFFGEKSFDVNDLVRTDSKGQGYINILRLTDIQNKPKLFSTFMLCLLAEIYEKFPELGDVAKPKLVIFIDEAHLIFDKASKALLDQIENVVRLIRSKGVGVYFSTQSPADIPNSILGQLGMKIQHALRAFTAKDRQAIKLISENYPSTEFYKVSDLLTALGTGEALVTVLNERGTPTPLVQTLMCTPESRMDTVTDAEIAQVVSASTLYNKYKETIDRESAYEILSVKMGQASTATTSTKVEKSKTGKPKKTVLEEIGTSPLARQVGRTLAKEITRGILGVLKKNSRS